MDIIITDQEVRVLGALMEKEMATPDYYPLTLNALTAACNQKSNRNPVVFYEETDVVRALDSLKEKQLARQSNVSRVPKYEEHFVDTMDLSRPEAAIMCLLLLRGPQTMGELRGRSERLNKFNDLSEVEDTLTTLGEMGLVTKLPRQPGCKECRYTHLLAGEPEVDTTATVSVPEAATLAVREEKERIAALEIEVKELRRKFEDLAQAFETFRKEFE
jgi:uncharacterized protein YceH (UPF0502 family)